MKQKIGSDVLKSKTPIISAVKSFHDGYKYGEEWRTKVLAVLQKAGRPLNIAEVQVLAKVPNWMAAKQILVDLEAQGKLEHFRSGRQVMFRIKRDASQDNHGHQVNFCRPESDKDVGRIMEEG